MVFVLPRNRRNVQILNPVRTAVMFAQGSMIAVGDLQLGRHAGGAAVEVVVSLKLTDASLVLATRSPRILAVQSIGRLSGTSLCFVESLRRERGSLRQELVVARGSTGGSAVEAFVEWVVSAADGRALGSREAGEDVGRAPHRSGAGELLLELFAHL